MIATIIVIPVNRDSGLVGKHGVVLFFVLLIHVLFKHIYLWLGGVILVPMKECYWDSGLVGEHGVVLFWQIYILLLLLLLLYNNNNNDNNNSSTSKLWLWSRWRTRRSPLVCSYDTCIRSVFIISKRKTSNGASQILKANLLLVCPYCLKFQIARV